MNITQQKRLARKHSGFTLIELVMVIVVLGIISVGSLSFISNSAQGLVDTAERQVLASTATIAVEKVLREVRRALPNSVRTFSDGSNECLELVPILHSSEYVSIPTASAATSFESIKFVTEAGTESGYVAVYPNSLISVYDSGQSISSSTGTASTVSGASTPNIELQTITFSDAAGYRFPTESPTKRFFLVDQPISFCDDINGRLWRYQNYGFNLDSTSSIPTTGSDRILIADSLKSNSLAFKILPAQLQRNAVVRMTVVIERGGTSTEQVDITQEVQLRNVP
ncbi:MAG TPA: MSHA biogenesis protein MshO [Oceanospirillales bacterium]|nr:MSHA biogenesis protein MshO [Oceanospirillales bacterium]